MKDIIKKSFKTSFDETQEGFVRAIISTFDVVDRDNDVITASAIKDGTPIKLCSWGHKWGDLPVGKGILKVDSKNAIFEGNFFLQTSAGKEAYETVKALGDLQEWSWGFSILPGGSEVKTLDGKRIRYINSVEAYEVSPVLVGANPYTGTVDIKSSEPTEEVKEIEAEEKSDDDLLEEVKEVEIEEKAIKCSDTNCNCDSEECKGMPTGEGNKCNDDSCTCSDEKCKGGAETKELTTETIDSSIMSLSSEAIVLLKQIAIMLINKEYMDSYLINWLLEAISMLGYIVSDELWAIAREAMNDAKSTTQKNNDIIKLYSPFLSDLITEKFGEEIIAEKERKALKYAEQGERILEEIIEYSARSRSLADLRAKEGRELSEANRKRLTSLLDALKTATSDIESLLTATQLIVAEEKADESELEVKIHTEDLITEDQRFKKLDQRLKLLSKK